MYQCLGKGKIRGGGGGGGDIERAKIMSIHESLAYHCMRCESLMMDKRSEPMWCQCISVGREEEQMMCMSVSESVTYLLS